MRSDSEAGSYIRLMDFVYHSALGLRVIKTKKKAVRSPASGAPPGLEGWASRIGHFWKTIIDSGGKLTFGQGVHERRRCLGGRRSVRVS